MRRKSLQFHPKPINVAEDSHLGGHGAAVLFLIREKIAPNWISLCRAFNYDPRTFHSGHLELRSSIQDLIAAHLISSRAEWKGPYQLTDRYGQIQHAPGVSLPQVANLPYYSGLAVQPFFGKPKLKDIGWHVFVLMPFEPALRKVYAQSIKGACATLRITVARADDIFSASAVLADITDAIYLRQEGDLNFTKARGAATGDRREKFDGRRNPSREDIIRHSPLKGVFPIYFVLREDSEAVHKLFLWRDMSNASKQS